MKDLYPVFLHLNKKKVLIVGGGSIATQKIRSLLQTGCEIIVVSPHITQEIQTWLQEKNVNLRMREFLPTDVNDIDLVFTATNDSRINVLVKMIANEKNILVNAVDDPPHCDFFVPSIVRRGSLVVAISTQGECPGFAKLLRKKLETMIPSSYGDFLAFLGRLRKKVKTHCKEFQERQSVMKDILYDGILEDLENKTLNEVQDKVENCISTRLR
ncbi:MAG: bifunctional precorrin-2 dehydrogenase/sirohydrochlorin ferrochelatase [Caldisericia bacterium]|nr:bifunctional precorrin-2 dehydrogenase/sirohydrochlorin ferrochelatase [Caldisericia bacterium]MDD4614442.1 bifunctional precorrin-2 dehydrogenase/sirohydrochlorin ferrochelatase [Caldisericia bacterium]